MAHLDKLDISKRLLPPAPSRRKGDDLAHQRRKLIANLEEQIELAELALAEKPLQLKRKRGHTIVPVRPRLWWRTGPDGQVHSEIRFNKTALNLAGRGRTITVKRLKSLPAAYRTIIRAIKAGELDRAIANATRQSGR